MNNFVLYFILYSHDTYLFFIPALVLGSKHKEKHDKDRLVASWRHKDWLLCSQGAIARLIFSTLDNLGNDFNFLWDPTERRRKYADWHYTNILPYRTYEQMASPIKRAIRYCGIPLNKATHIRQHAMEYNGFLVSFFCSDIFLIIVILIKVLFSVGYGSRGRLYDVQAQGRYQ